MTTARRHDYSRSNLGPPAEAANDNEPDEREHVLTGVLRFPRLPDEGNTERRANSHQPIWDRKLEANTYDQ